MDPNKEFEQNMKQLMHLLKKIMSQYPGFGKDPSEMMKFLKDMKNKQSDINIFFLNLAPLSLEEFEEIEEMMEDKLYDSFHSGELKCELNSDDQDFLKRHGIRF